MATLIESVMDNLITAVVVLDENFVVTYANPAAEQLFCLSARRLREQPLSDVIQHCSIDLAQVQETLATGQGLTDSDVTLVIDGNQRKVELSASPLQWERSSSMLVELKAIGHQQQISKELQQQAQQQAAKELVRGLAHEIKNPLGGLRGAAQLLEKMLPDPSLSEYTRIIIEQADRLRNLVDRLLGPQRPGHRQQENIHVVLEKVRQLVELSAGEITIHRDYDPSLPDLEMDPDQLEQALLNVVSNAAEILQDTPQGEITLRTRTEHQVVINGKRHRLAARIDITDNGPGISPDIQDTLFYPMVSGRPGGTGLGLSITRNLVDQHKGKILVNSWPGQTTFTILLPIKR
ncbi:nitrogen regulation protein NR(II) [Enterovibrio coralii]|uniref:Sensory histidine kinase/phosphatase NtrB n=1 Tax=Enterovibrio coralii TaxID=294935 RepID=A0A135IAQ4_9GAMM|nr:nitrogen regulation protein NR(II) [Enterovibrio coralii]KXF82522.1 PAS domain-containing sensor histidine kinase [Enterovibrio coralii]